jgi:RNA polymerase sigma-70 factor (ECF subfamily)
MPASDAAERSDHELLAAARVGDDTALATLLARHQAQVYRFGMHMCRDPEDAKDVLQDTLLAMARSVRDFRGASSLSTWLYAIARSFCLKKRRRSKFAPETEHSLESDASAEVRALEDPAAEPETIVAGKEIEHALGTAIASLPPMYREVLLLRDVEGLTAAEVAEVLGIGVDAVKSRLHRARLRVRERIAPLLQEDAPPPAAPGTCPDVLALFSRHVEDEISAEVCAEMERHLASCARCRGACDSLRRTLALCRTIDAAIEVPASVQSTVKSALREFLTENRPGA